MFPVPFIDIHVIPISTRQFMYEVGQLRLRGDVIIRCYQIIPNDRAYQEKRELIFSTQFHTCAITEKTISFGRGELDYACDGKCCFFIRRQQKYTSEGIVSIFLFILFRKCIG